MSLCPLNSMRVPYLISLCTFTLALPACTVDFNDFDPYTKPGAYAGEMAELDMNLELDMDLSDMDMEIIPDMDMMPPPIIDGDQDGVADEVDNCPNVANPDQLDGDSDGLGNLCDDEDMDEILDYRTDGEGGSVQNDNCLAVPNNDQRDSDWDGLGDACDDDLDGDGLNQVQETELGTDPQVADSDGDGFIDSDDLCPTVPSLNLDQDGDGLGNACDLDDDDDGIYDWIDACPFTADPEQTANAEEAAQGRGTACADDFDADGILDADDPCPLIPSGLDRSSLSCENNIIFRGFDADIYDLYLSSNSLWSASSGGLSKFALTEQGQIDLSSEMNYALGYGLWSPKNKKLDLLKVVGPNQLEIKGLWVVNGGRLSALRYEGQSGQYRAYEIDLSSYGVSEVHDVIGFDLGALVATDYGLYVVAYNGITNLEVGMMNPEITQLYHDEAAGYIWFTVDSVLYRVNTATPDTVSEVATIEGMNAVRKIMRDDRGPDTHMLLILSEQEVLFYDVTIGAVEEPRIPVSAYDALPRPYGYYFATAEGIVHSGQGQITSQPLLRAVQSAKTRVMTQTDQNLILGSASDTTGTGRPDGRGSVGGIRSGGGLWQHIELEQLPCIIDSELDSAGTLWLATPTGLYKRDYQGVQTLVIEEPIYDILLYSDSLWVATNSTVYQMNTNEEGQPVSYPPSDLTPSITALFGVNGRLWIGAQDGIAYADLDPTTNTLNAWTEFKAADVTALPSGETIGFGYESDTLWIAIRGGGLARYNSNGFVDTIYSENNSILPSNLITGLSVNDRRIIVTTEIGVHIFKPVLTGDLADLIGLFPGRGIPIEAGTGHVLGVADSGGRLWMYTKPTNERVYGGLMTRDADDPDQVLSTEGSERFYDEYQVDMLKSTLPEVMLEERSRVRFNRLENGSILLSMCGDETSPGGVGLLDAYKAIEDEVPARGLIGSDQGALVPSPRGHAMVASAFGELASDEAGLFGPGYTLTQDLYAPLQEGEMWAENLEPRPFKISSEALAHPIQDCRAYQQPGEATKRLTCILKGAYIARQVVNNWIAETEPLLNDNRLLVKDFLLDPSNPVNNIWIASDRGLINMRAGQANVLTVDNTEQKLPSDDIRALAWNPMLRTLYIGTSRGLVALNASVPLPANLSMVELEPLGNDPTLSKGTIYSLYFSEDQTLWISTRGGVASYREGQFTLYKQGETLPATPVNAIAELDGALYFSHPKGISRYQAGEWTHYGSRDGISPIKGRFVKDDRGTLWGLGNQGAFGFQTSTP